MKVAASVALAFVLASGLIEAHDVDERSGNRHPAAEERERPRTPNARAGVKTHPRTPDRHNNVRAGVKTPRSMCSTDSDCEADYGEMSPYDPFCIDGWCYYHDCFAASECVRYFGSNAVCEISEWGNTCCGNDRNGYYICFGH